MDVTWSFTTLPGSSISDVFTFSVKVTTPGQLGYRRPAETWIEYGTTSDYSMRQTSLVTQ